MSTSGNAGGRPTKYKPEYCQMLIDHMKEGGSFESFAAKCDVHWDTLYEWCKVHPEFSEAKSIGIAKLLAFDEQVGLQGATGQLKFLSKTIRTTNEKPDGEIEIKEETFHQAAAFSASYFIFLKKNRYPRLYRDKIVVENENPQVGKMKAVFDEIMSDPELAGAAAKIAAKLAEE